MWVVEWYCLEGYLHPIGYVMSIFAMYPMVEGVMVLRRRWSDLAHSFASVPLLGYIPSICAVGELVETDSSRYGGRCLPWLDRSKLVVSKKIEREKGRGEICM